MIEVRKFTFPPNARLRKTREFENVFENGLKIVKQSIVVFYLLNDEEESRLGVVASRKTGKAHVRNRIKRRMRELFRTNRHIMSSSMDIVVIARRTITKHSFNQIKQDFCEMLDEANRRSSRG